MSLSHEDVQRLLQLLDASKFDELHLDSEGTKLTLRRSVIGGNRAPSPVPAAFTQAEVTLPLPAMSTASSASTPSQIATANLIDVRASMLGTFYGAPKPGAEPFVKVGSRVESDTVIGIIEVMKLMNSISVGVAGDVVEVLVRDGDLVEFDQVLMRVRPRGAA